MFSFADIMLLLISLQLFNDLKFELKISSGYGKTH